MFDGKPHPQFQSKMVKWNIGYVKAHGTAPEQLEELGRAPLREPRARSQERPRLPLALEEHAQMLP